MPTLSPRLVIVLAPIFVGLAGWVVTLAARYMPGHPHLDREGLAAVFIAGASWAAAHVLLWLHKHLPVPRAGPVAPAPAAVTSAEEVGTPGMIAPPPPSTPAYAPLPEIGSPGP